jgi:hypothetical protein
MNVDILAVAAAAVASWLFGAVWYMALAKPWMAALGKTEADLKQPRGPWGPNWVPFVLSLVAQFVMAWVFAGLLGHLGFRTVRSGMISAVFVWLGFVATTLSTNHAFGGAKPKLTLIDGGHWLGVLVIQGAIIGAILGAFGP